MPDLSSVPSSSFRRTPFHAAAASGQVDCLRLLLDAAADLGANDHPTSSSSSSSRHRNNNDDDEHDGSRSKGTGRSLSSGGTNNNNMEPVSISRLGSCSSRKIQRGSVGNRNSFSRAYMSWFDVKCFVLWLSPIRLNHETMRTKSVSDISTCTKLLYVVFVNHQQSSP